MSTESIFIADKYKLGPPLPFRTDFQPLNFFGTCFSYIRFAYL